MKITNTSGKIIGIGTLTLLPGATELLPKEFEENPVILGFAEKKLVKLAGSVDLEAKAAAKAKAEQQK